MRKDLHKEMQKEMRQEMQKELKRPRPRNVGGRPRNRRPQVGVSPKKPMQKRQPPAVEEIEPVVAACGRHVVRT